MNFFYCQIDSKKKFIRKKNLQKKKFEFKKTCRGNRGLAVIKQS